MLGLVLAAGLGTRLRPLTETLPKPAVPVGNRPLASFAVDHLVRAGAGVVRANAYHLAPALIRALEGHVPEAVDFGVRVERELLGTGGGIRALLEDAPRDDTIVVMNGDVLFAPDLAAAIATHRAVGALATMILRRHPDPANLGAVEIDAGRRVRRIVGRPSGLSAAGLSAFTFTGVHVLSRALLEHLPTNGCVVRDGYIPLLSAGATIAGHVDDSPWFDLGTPASYLEANIALASGRFAWPGVVARGAIIDATAELSRAASIERSVIGRGARIDARVEDTVVWSGTHVTRDLRRAIAWPGGVLDVP